MNKNKFLLYSFLLSTISFSNVIEVNDRNSFENAIANARLNDTIRLTSDISIPNHYSTNRNNAVNNYDNYNIASGVTIDGNNHKLKIIGRNLSLNGDTTFKNINLVLALPNTTNDNFKNDIGYSAVIYANENNITLDNVKFVPDTNEKLAVAPTIIMGNEISKESNNNKENTLTILNANEKLRLKTIVAGSENKPKTSKSIIKIPSNVKLDMEGGKILLKNTGNATNENLDVLVENSSREVRTFSTNNNSNVNIVLDNVKYGFIKDAKLKLDGEIDNLTLKGETLVEILDETNIGTLNLSKDEMERYPTIKIDKVEATNWGDDDFPTSTDNNNNGRLVVNKIISNTDNAVIDLLNSASASVNTVEGNFRLKDVEDRANFNGLPIDKGNPTIDNAIDDTSKPTVPTTNDTDTNDNPISVDNSNGGTDAGNSTIGSGGNTAPSVDEPNNQDGGNPTENNDNTAVDPIEPTNPSTEEPSNTDTPPTNEPNNEIDKNPNTDNSTTSTTTDNVEKEEDKTEEPTTNNEKENELIEKDTTNEKVEEPTTDKETTVETEKENETPEENKTNNEPKDDNNTNEETDNKIDKNTTDSIINTNNETISSDKTKIIPIYKLPLNSNINKMINDVINDNYYIIENIQNEGMWISSSNNITKYEKEYKTINNGVIVGFNNLNNNLKSNFSFSYNNLKLKDKIDEIKSDLFSINANNKIKINNNIFSLISSLSLNKSNLVDSVIISNKAMYGYEINLKNNFTITPNIELQHILVKEKEYNIPNEDVRVFKNTNNYYNSKLGTKFNIENNNFNLYSIINLDVDLKNKKETRYLTVKDKLHMNINDKKKKVIPELLIGSSYKLTNNLNLSLNYKTKFDKKIFNKFDFNFIYQL